MNNRSQMYLSLGMGDEALRDATEVFKWDPSNVKAAYRAAQANELLGNFHQARDFYLKVLEIDRNHSSAVLLLQKIDDRLKRPVDTVSEHSTSEERIPSTIASKSVPKYQKKLESIRMRTPDIPTVPPSTAYELERTWRGLRGRADLFATYLSCFKKSTFRKACFLCYKASYSNVAL